MKWPIIAIWLYTRAIEYENHLFKIDSRLNNYKKQQHNLIDLSISIPKGRHAYAKSNVDRIKVIESRCTQLNTFYALSCMRYLTTHIDPRYIIWKEQRRLKSHPPLILVFM